MYPNLPQKIWSPIYVPYAISRAPSLIHVSKYSIMKKFYVSLFLIGVIFALTSMVSSEQKRNIAVSSVNMMNGDDPVLPDQPYNYKDIVFPQFAIDMLEMWGGPFDPLTVTDHIDNETATLGRVLFYDTKLSSNNEISCASCHKQEFSFADNVAFSEGIEGTLMTRNSPNLNDLEWGADNFFFDIIFIDPIFLFGSNHAYFWDCRDTTLETAVLQPIVADDELGKDLTVLVNKLNDTDYYPNLFASAFGDSEITTERIGTAMAHFIRSMISFESKFDKAEQGFVEYTPAELAGRDIFENSCGFTCHSLPNGSIKTPMNNGLDEMPEDPGAAGWMNDEMGYGLFKSPSLRNVALTAPYMHDGRFETLEEVIDFYSDEIQESPNSSWEWIMGTEFEGFDFSEEEKDNLLAFLHTLTNEEFITDPKFSDPFESNVGTFAPKPLLEIVSVYPNPVRDAARVTIENTQNKTFQIDLTTMDGKIIQSLQTADNETIVDLNDVAKGVYFLKIREADRQEVLKLVVQ